MNKNQQEFIGKQLTITKSNSKEQEQITGKIKGEDLLKKLKERKIGSERAK